ncbi:MAG: hypothetical protein V7L21_07035 [Nostoc sp.]|uniref:hypothetical protein n=1 Tax=unclassified Nostoc TaxID=2593658 RepID=UPI0025FEB830|nr:hypothetical protein [Nostoc sp. NMS9]MBN3941109.1 hypothetical protein [Nostoc sp. NMS9]
MQIPSDTGETQVLLGIMLNVKKPKIYSDGTSYLVAAESYIKENNIDTFLPSFEFTNFLKSQGYDAVEIQSLGCILVFEPDQVVVVKTEVFR